MRISEIFRTIQGEGKLAGVPSVFVRTSGCNLRCTWCDTAYASWNARGWNRTVDEIVAEVTAMETRHVVLTGGEPMIAAGIGELTRALRRHDRHITIETAATIWNDVVCDLASISPKLAHSVPRTRENGKYATAHDRNRINLDVIRRLMEMPDYQLKFVVNAPDDLAEIESLVSQLGNVTTSDILLMPQGDTADDVDARGEWIAELCQERGYRFCPRLHIARFGNVRGT